MSIRNFDALFEPKTIVIVTAREGARQFEPILLRNLREAGFSHTIMTVNSADTIDAGVSAQLTAPPDLAIVAEHPDRIPSVIAELGRNGCRAAILIDTGLDTPHRSGLLRDHLATQSSECQLRASDAGARQYGLRQSVGGDRERHARLGIRARDRILAYRIVGKDDRRRFRRRSGVSFLGCGDAIDSSIRRT